MAGPARKCATFLFLALLLVRFQLAGPASVFSPTQNNHNLFYFRNQLRLDDGKFTRDFRQPPKVPKERRRRVQRGFQVRGDSQPSSSELQGSSLWLVSSPQRLWLVAPPHQGPLSEAGGVGMYYNLLKQPIYAQSHCASSLCPKLIFLITSTKLFLLFVCRHCRSWERWPS